MLSKILKICAPVAILCFVFILIQISRRCRVERKDCNSGHICAKTWHGIPEESCIEIPEIAQIHLEFPFHPLHPVKCQQGNAVAKRSHSYDNTLFAVDLHSLPNSEPGIIYAAADGVAHVFDECEFRLSGSNVQNWSGPSVPFTFKIRYSDRTSVEFINSTQIRWATSFNPPYLFGVW
jgi:hypothetical protein